MPGLILLIEDDPNIGELLSMQIGRLGYSFEQVRDGRLGLERARDSAPALILLDMNLPSLSGIEICTQLKRDPRCPPIIIITSHGEQQEIVDGLSAGADDYVVKPFSVHELLARVRARLRIRSSYPPDGNSADTPGTESSSELRVSDLMIDPVSHTVTAAGRPIELTLKEFELLSYLALHPDRIVTREQIAEVVWGIASDPNDALVSTLILRLRRKLDQVPGRASYIRTVRSVGYRFQDPCQNSGNDSSDGENDE